MEVFSKLPHEIYYNAVEKIAKLHNLSDKNKYEFEYSAGSAKGDNYVGMMYRIRIKSKEDNAVKLSMVAKFPPANTARRDEFQTDAIFAREIQFYDVLFPMYKKFQEEHGVKIDTEGFHEAPHAQLTLSEPYEAIFLEDLQVRHFEMHSRFEDKTREHVLLVMKALAKMHAIFFCIKDQKPELVKSFVEMEDFLIFITRTGKTLLTAWYDGTKVHALRALEKFEDSQRKEKIRKFLDMDMLKMLEELIGNTVAEPYSTICHGDVWSNNMMFRNDENGVPVEVSLLDFQILRYTSPVIDVVHHIFTTTTKELRDQYYQEFLDTYYETLAGMMRRLNSDPEKLYPRQVFHDHLIRFGKFGLYMGVLALPAVTSSPENTPDIDAMSERIGQAPENGEQHTLDFVPSEKYEQRMLGVFEDIFEFGYL